MAIKKYDDTNFTMIASAIRAKNGKSTTYKPRDMAAAINALTMARDVEPNASASGINVSFPDGADGEKYNSLVLNIPLLQTGSGDPTPTNKRLFKSYERFKVFYSGADTSDYETYTLNHSMLGGTLDLISGAEHYFNNSLMLVNYSNSLTIYTDTTTGVNIFYLPWAYESFGDIYSESFKTVDKQASLSEAAANMPNNSIAGAKDAAVGTIGFFIRADSFSTVSELIAACGTDKNYATAWMVDTTITSGLFTDVTALGVNNLWSIGYQVFDEQLTQNIPLEVSYKADPTLYANNLVYETVRDLLPQDTASGAIANFPDGSDGYPVVELKANIDPIQEGTGDPSPSNVRPISGRSSCKITRASKNLFDKSNTSQIIEAYISGSTSISVSNYHMRTVWIDCKPSTTYTISKTAGQRFAVAYTTVTPDFGVSVYGTVSNNTGSTLTITTGADAKYLVAFIYNDSVDSGTAQDMIDSVQIEVGSTATAYEAYQTPQEKTINFGTTIYGGVLNVTTGVLTVNKAYIKMDSLNWSMNSSGTSGQFYSSVLEVGAVDTDSNNTWCECYKPSGLDAYNNIPSKDKVLSVKSRIWVLDRDYSSSASFIAAIPNNCMVVYTLATPYDIQLTPEEVKTILGVNNIYADSGDVEVKYRADIALYIDKISNS